MLGLGLTWSCTFLTLQWKIALEESNCWKHITMIIVHFLWYLNFSYHVCFFSRSHNEVFIFVFILCSKWIIFKYLSMELILSRLLIVLSFRLASIVVQFTLSNSNFSQSSIQSSAGPFWVLQQNEMAILHPSVQFLLYICLFVVFLNYCMHAMYFCFMFSLILQLVFIGIVFLKYWWALGCCHYSVSIL